MTCPKCHTCPCWCHQRQAPLLPPSTALPTSPRRPHPSAAATAAHPCPQVRLPSEWVGMCLIPLLCRYMLTHWALAQTLTLGFPGGPTHLAKPTATSSSERERERDRERERERDKSILASTTTVEHAPIWRPGRAPQTPPHPQVLMGHLGLPPDSAACHQVRSRAAGLGAAAAPPPTPTSTRPSPPGPRTPCSRGPVCCTTRA